MPSGVAYWHPGAEQDTEAGAIGGPNFTMHEVSWRVWGSSFTYSLYKGNINNSQCLLKERMVETSYANTMFLKDTLGFNYNNTNRLEFHFQRTPPSPSCH